MIIKVSSEWDLGLGLNYCEEGTLAEVEKRTAENFKDFERELGMTFQEACDDGLISFEEH